MSATSTSVFLADILVDAVLWHSSLAVLGTYSQLMGGTKPSSRVQIRH